MSCFCFYSNTHFYGSTAILNILLFWCGDRLNSRSSCWKGEVKMILEFLGSNTFMTKNIQYMKMTHLTTAACALVADLVILGCMSDFSMTLLLEGGDAAEVDICMSSSRSCSSLCPSSWPDITESSMEENVRSPLISSALSSCSRTSFSCFSSARISRFFDTFWKYSW